MKLPSDSRGHISREHYFDEQRSKSKTHIYDEKPNLGGVSPQQERADESKVLIGATLSNSIAETYRELLAQQGTTISFHISKVIFDFIEESGTPYPPALKAEIARFKGGRRRGRQKKGDLVSSEPDYTGPMLGEPTTPAGERGSPRPPSASPLPEAGHEQARPEAPSPARQIAELLAQHTNASVDDAETIVNAMRINVLALVEASKKLLKPKSRFYTRSDFTKEELNDPVKVGEARKTVNLHRRDRIDDLDDKTADELRRASALLRYSKYQPRAKPDNSLAL